MILDKCTLSPPNCPDPEEPYYSVMFNYEFVEDFQNEQQPDRYVLDIHVHVHVATLHDVQASMKNYLISDSDVKMQPRERKKKFDESRVMVVATWKFVRLRRKTSPLPGVQ